jgi:hypothetical protein
MTAQQKRQTTMFVEEQDQVGLALKQAAQQNETSELEEAVVALLNVAISEHGCLMCGQGVENHAEGCPIWGLEEWLNPIAI